MTDTHSKDAKQKQEDDRLREEQKSHRDQQNRSKKDGHTSQIGSGQDQISQRNRGPAPRR